MMDNISSKLKNVGKNGSTEEKKPLLESEMEKGYEETSVSIKEELPSHIGSSSASINTVIDKVPKLHGNYFEDGKTKIDFVLVYEEKCEEKNNDVTLSSSEKAKQRQLDHQDKQHRKWRSKFIRNLRMAGIKLEMDENESPEKIVHFIKLSCSWELLVRYAEELHVKAPLQLRDHSDQHFSDKMLKKVKLPNCMNIDVPNQPHHYFTCDFKKSKLFKYLGCNDKENFFSASERARITYEILQSIVYGKKKRAELGIDRLVSEEVFSAAFPLHDGPYEIPQSAQNMDPRDMNQRQVLYEYWARWGRWYKYQPIDHIKQYFGEKIAMYFAWLGFYTAWLLPVAIIGLIVFISGIATMPLDTPAVEICESGDRYLMCPLCSLCTTWNLSSTCLYAKVSYLFDNGGTVFFAILMSFWAVFFLEFWKRKTAQLAHHWDVLDFEEEEERPRPEFHARAPAMEANPITGVLEPHFPSQQRAKRMFTGFAILIIMLAVVLIFVLSVIIYKGIVGLVMMHSKNKLVHGQASTMGSFSGAVINLILIMLMSNVYTVVAEWLTEWEMQRTQTDYENSLTFKVFIFQFVNYYSSIFYIAFFKGNMVGYPGNYQMTFGLRNEGCGAGGCLIELAQQLFVIMVGKQAINNVQELLIPKVKQWLQRRKMKDFEDEEAQILRKPWESQYYRLLHFGGLFEEYLEMVLQFGFITIFVAAFPLAPLFALLNNWIEIRLDAQKFVCETRRPVSVRAENIGVWFDILDALVQVAVISNAFLIAFTSEFIPRLVYANVIGDGSLAGYTNFTLSYAPNETGRNECRYSGYRDREGHHTMYYYELLCARLAFVIAFEHLVFFVGRLIDWSVPDVPEDIQLKMKRENFLAKQALTDVETVVIPTPANS